MITIGTSFHVPVYAPNTVWLVDLLQAKLYNNICHQFEDKFCIFPSVCEFVLYAESVSLLLKMSNHEYMEHFI
jgi:hypothetical protein